MNDTLDAAQLYVTTKLITGKQGFFLISALTMVMYRVIIKKGQSINHKLLEQLP